MHRLKIDGRPVDVADGATVLAAARRAGSFVPTLCEQEGLSHFTSCMVCVVREAVTGKMIPACSAPAADGMDIETDTAEVRDSRRVALELLLSDHLGDCEGPCHRICPARMDIPLMIRQIAAGDFRAALVTVKRDIPLPAVLGRICPAPCEGGCRRKQIDAPVSICLLKRFVADVDLATREPFVPARQAPTGRRVAIVGAGPAGLSAAYYLAAAGHACAVFDAAERPGGALRTAVPEEALPRDVLDAETELVRRQGVVFRAGVRVGRDVGLDALRAEHDAVVLATGPIDAAQAAALGLPATKRGIAVDAAGAVTGQGGLFAAGAAVGPCKMAVRAVGQGKDVAISVGQALRGEPVTGPADRFNSVIGKLLDEEKERVMEGVSGRTRVAAAGGAAAGFTPEEARAEAARCLHCDCRRPRSCRLRQYAESYGARQSRYKPIQRRAFTRNATHPSLVFEQGKCISCGICIRIARQAGESLGLSFIGRGIETRVGVPFGETLGAGLTTAADACVRGCPTGALAFAAGEETP